MSGRLLKLRRSPALFTRAGVKDERCWFVPYGGETFEFENPVCQPLAPGVSQELYCVPEIF